MQSDSKNDLGVLVRERRKALGLNQTELGALAGCGRPFVSMVERGKQTVRFDKLLDLLEALGLQVRIENGSERLVAEEPDARD